MGKKKYNHVSLFSGAGGLDIGLEQAGFKTIWANDFAHDACETHKLWSKAVVVEGDIGAVDFETIPDCDIASFGFPCQGFSLSGPRKIDDSRNTLYRYCVKLVEKKQPKVFLAENVKGLLTLGDGKIKDAIISDFESKGYVVTINLVNAADYHVPEDRQRVIIVGIRKDLVEKYGVSFDIPKPFEDRITLREALKDFGDAKPEDVCDAPYSSRYMSRNRKRGWDEVAFTVPAMAKQVTLWPGSPDMIKFGPDHWEFGTEGVTRRLSYKEAAAIQTFPKDMKFCGDLTSKYKQIGNAVPCELARNIGLVLYDILKKCDT
jgi:DNA (cytosine-5)-methyltransferase 1